MQPSLKRSSRWLTGILLLLALSAGAPSILAGTWKAGVARVDITPEGPIWMAGYAARDRPSEGILQRLHVKALALEDSRGQVSVLVSADLIGFRRPVADRIAAEVESRYGLSRDRLVLNASHTHSGPALTTTRRPVATAPAEEQKVVSEYAEGLIEDVVQVIGRALERLEPAELSFGQGFAGFAVNRRRVRDRSLPGPTDHDVPVLAVRRDDGSLLAVAFGYACHATVLSGYEINGDWPGYAQEKLEERFEGVTALFVTGCGADQNPLPRRRVDLARRYGETLAFAVELVLEGETAPVEGPLNTSYRIVDLPFQAAPSREELQRRLREGTSLEQRNAEQLLRTLEEEGELPGSYPYPLQVWRFGEGLTLIGLAGEAVVDYSLRFKHTYGWESTWVSAYNNDAFSYVPSLRVLKEGDYEGETALLGVGFPAPFSWAVEELIAEAVDDLMEETRPR